MAESARSQPATSELRAAILDLIARPLRPFLLTTTALDVPYSRPVICVNDGFQIEMVTRRHSKKVGHLRRNPAASLLWVEPPKSVLLQGRVAVIDDAGAVASFYERYARKNPERTRFDRDDDVARVILRLRPEFCRADWFAGYVPVIMRQSELEGAP